MWMILFMLATSSLSSIHALIKYDEHIKQVPLVLQQVAQFRRLRNVDQNKNLAKQWNDHSEITSEKFLRNNCC